MNLSHLQYFRELAQVQHYTKAAHNLFISQPTLSHSIASLEDELGVKLFEKNGRTVKLTDDGALFAQYVERSLDALGWNRRTRKTQGAPFWNCAPWSNPFGPFSFPPRSGIGVPSHPRQSC